MKEGEQLTPADLEEMKRLWQECEEAPVVIIEGKPTDSLEKHFRAARKAHEFLGYAIAEIAALWAEHGHPVSECPSKSGPHHDLTMEQDGSVSCANKGCEQRWKPEFPEAA